MLCIPQCTVPSRTILQEYRRRSGLIALTSNPYLITLGCLEHIHGSAASSPSRHMSPSSSPLSFPTITSPSSPSFAPWGSALPMHAWSSPMYRSRNGLKEYEGGPRHLRRRRSSFFDDKEGLSYCALLGYPDSRECHRTQPGEPLGSSPTDYNHDQSGGASIRSSAEPKHGLCPSDETGPFSHSNTFVRTRSRSMCPSIDQNYLDRSMDHTQC